MQYYTFTNWQQVESWIRDNGLARWAFAAKCDPDGKMSLYVANSEWYAGDMSNKLQQTQKALEAQPGRYLYGLGWKNDNKTGGEASCEVMISAAQAPAGVGGFPMFGQQPSQPIGAAEREEMRRTIRDEIMTEINKQQYEKDRKELDEERAAFEAEKQSALGLAVGYLAPIAQALQQRVGLKKVAGIDTAQPIYAKPIQPVQQEPGADEAPADDPQDNEDSPFTDAEAETLMALMKRFKAAEPDYLKLLAAVVEMAESGDATYTMAKGFLMK